MDKNLTIAGKNIFYRVTGSGQPVMLVHGFGETGDVWKGQVSQLSRKFQFIIPDLPGSGASDMVGEMSMEGMAEVLKLIWDAEQLSSSFPHSDISRVMIGHSMGGYVTLAFVDKYQGYLMSFGLFHSSAFADTEEKKTTRRKGIEFIKRHGGFEFLQTSTPNLFSPLSKAEFPGLIDDFVDSLSGFRGESLIAYYQAMVSRPETTSVLKNATLPVLFIAGQYDNAISLADVLKQCHLPARSSFHILQRSAHMGMLEETDKANSILEEFLSGII